MRGRRYAINGDQNVASPTASALGLTSATTIRPTVYDVLIGCQDTPADAAIEWFVQRYTAAGTGTAVTPTALDPGDPAATATAAKNHTAEPTYTAGLILWRMALNQRASHRWIADPDGGLVCPALASNGVGLYPVHATVTVNTDCTFHLQE